MIADFRTPSERTRIERERRYGKFKNVRPYTGHPGQYRGTIERVPERLSPEQLAAFDKAWPDYSKRKPNYAAVTFQHA